jgi:tRNA(adenine34) deaminase
MQANSHFTSLMRDLIYWTKEYCPTSEVPISAIVLDAAGVEISRSANQRVETNNPIGHAEILAIAKAGEISKNWRLDGHTLLVTVEPCAMCAGAILQSRISRLVFGAFEPKTGAITSTAEFLRDAKPAVEVIGGVLADETAQLLAEWFSKDHR